MEWPPCLEFWLWHSQWCHWAQPQGCGLAHQGLTKVSISTSADWLPHWRERAKSTMFLTQMFYILFSLLFGGNNYEKESKEGKSSNCRLVFRQINSSKKYIGDLRICTFMLLKRVRYSSTKQRQKERDTEWDYVHLFLEGTSEIICYTYMRQEAREIMWLPTPRPSAR